jgi:hypothetical protein
MFKNKRYATNGVVEKVSNYLQNLLWYMVETMDIETKDCLQVFEINENFRYGKPVQRILHTQENPLYQNENIITVEKPLNIKIFVIDDGDHSTMLLADEY